MKFYKSVAVICSIIAFNGELKCSTYSDLDGLDAETRNGIVREIYTDPTIVLAAQQAAKDVTELFDKEGIRCWLGFGSLLGALRQRGEDGTKSGGMIPWDDDTDLCVNEEVLGVIRDRPFRAKLAELGYDIVLHPEVGCQIRSKTMVVNPKTKEKIIPFVDIFMVKLSEDGTKYEIYPEKVKSLWPKGWFGKEQIDHLQQIQFGGFTVWAPSNPEEYLTRFYGADWKTKGYYYFSHHSKFNGNKKWTLVGTDLDPAQRSGPLKNRVQGYPVKGKLALAPALGFAESNKVFWDQFYAVTALAREPSTFCTFLLENKMITPGSTLVDIGCGNGRDTFAFKAKGVSAIGVDSSKEAVAKNLEFASGHQSPSDMFRVVDVAAEGAMMAYKDYDNIYARFFIHALTEPQQKVFEQFLSQVKAGGRLLLEFRTDKDPMFAMSTKVGASEGKTDHYRRFINFKAFCETLERLNYTISFAIEEGNLSVAYKEDPVKGRIEDNPVLGRIVATKNASK